MQWLNHRRHLRFIAPEALSSKQTITPGADIYSWAATAFELINSERLQTDLDEDGESPELLPEFYGAVHAHSTRTLPSLKTLFPSIPEELSAVISKAGSLDPDERYVNFASLLFDLNRVKDICEGHLRRAQRGEFVVGKVDSQSRFKIPPGLLDREAEYAMLDDAYKLVKTTGQSQVVCCYGRSGSGKSKLLDVWARAKERESAGQSCLVGWAKVRRLPECSHVIRWCGRNQMDQHLVKPLSAFISVFCSLLARVFSDPLESTSQWRRSILDSLAVNANIFLALLPKEWRVILLDGQVAETMDNDMTAGIDWESWVKQFRTWSYGLLRLFVSEKRPLVIVFLLHLPADR
jgi:hypothetical protein